MGSIYSLVAGLLLAILLLSVGPQQCAGFEPPHPYSTGAAGKPGGP
jgi:hypothetical protein